MPCLYCGKRVPLVRLSDRDFCSDEHRTRYRKLASSVLDRLGGPLDAQPETPSERAGGKPEPPQRKAGPAGLAGPLPAWACFNMRALASPAKPAIPGFSVPAGAPDLLGSPPSAGSNGLGLAGPAEPAPLRAFAPSEPNPGRVAIAPPTRKPPRGAGLRPGDVPVCSRGAPAPARRGYWSVDAARVRAAASRRRRSWARSRALPALEPALRLRPAQSWARLPALPVLEPAARLEQLVGPGVVRLAQSWMARQVSIAPAVSKPALGGLDTGWLPQPLPPPARGPLPAPPDASAPGPACAGTVAVPTILNRGPGGFPAERPRTGFSRWLAGVQAGQPLPAAGIAIPAPAALSFSPRFPAAREVERPKPRLKRALVAKGKAAAETGETGQLPAPAPRRRTAPKRPSAAQRSVRAALDAASYVPPASPAPASGNAAPSQGAAITTPAVLRPEPGHEISTRVPGVAGPIPLRPSARAGENLPAVPESWQRALPIPASRLEPAEDHRRPPTARSSPSLAGVPARPAVAPVPGTAELRPALGGIPRIPGSSGLKPVSDPKLVPAEPAPVHTPSGGVDAPGAALAVDLAGDPVRGRLGPLRSCFGLRLGMPDLPGSCRSRLRALAVRREALPSRIPWVLDPRPPVRRPMPEPHLFALPAPAPQIDYRALVFARFAAIPVPVRLLLVAAPFLLWISLWARQSAPSVIEAMSGALANRAAVEVLEDFRGGTKHWLGASDWTRGAGGMIRTGRFALLDAGRAVSDYDFEFLGQIRTHRMSWVFRAADARNYYAGSLVIRKPGPVPEFALERYAVINGRRQDAGEVPLPRLMHNDSPYRIKVRVRGDGFATFVEGRMVDYWTHDRFKTGSVGFVSAPDEHAYLYWVKVSYQNDWLGRLCARLAPANQGWTQ